MIGSLLAIFPELLVSWYKTWVQLMPAGEEALEVVNVTCPALLR
jgi:hypothetical protein